jgi:hypothetical protein
MITCSVKYEHLSWQGLEEGGGKREGGTAKALPISEWHVAEMAQGRAVRGSAKFLVARTTPSAEFCMPVSIATVRDTVVG